MQSGVPSEAFLTKIFAPSPSDERSLPTALIPLIGNYLEYVRDVEWRDDGREVVTKEEAGKDWKVMDTVYGCVESGRGDRDEMALRCMR